MSSATVLILMVLGVIAGSLLPLQNAINTRIAKVLHSVILATTVSFLMGTIFLGLIFLLSSPSPSWATIFAQQPIWIWFGGVFGIIFFMTLILQMKYFGASVAIVFAVCGQVIGGLIIDTFGLLEVKAQALTLPHLLGAILVIIGAIAVTIAGSKKKQGGPHTEVSPTLRILLPIAGVAAGCLSAAQTAVNGRLGLVLASPVSSAFVSFATGTISLFVIVIIVTILSRSKESINYTEAPWWMWVSGGILGSIFILTNAMDAPLLGTSLTVSVVLLGQIIGGLAIDHYGVLGTVIRSVTAKRIIGAALVLGGVVITRFS